VRCRSAPGYQRLVNATGDDRTCCSASCAGASKHECNLNMGPLFASRRSNAPPVQFIGHGTETIGTAVLDFSDQGQHAGSKLIGTSLADDSAARGGLRQARIA
jgi:hypothetical protein